MSQQLDGIERDLSQIVAALKSREEAGGHNSTNTIRIEGAGSIWNGIAIGVALAGVVMGSAWIAHTASSAEVAVRQAEAYRAAVYMVAPKAAEEIEKELQRKKERDKQ